MIHTNELMLGNWVEYATGLHRDKQSIPMKVVALFDDCAYLDFDGNPGDVWEEDEENLLGIPITEYLLEKCGWQKTHSLTYRSYFGDEKSDTFVSLENKDGTFELIKTGQHCGGATQLRYLHELQNAYFMLTKKHLEVKL